MYDLVLTPGLLVRQWCYVEVEVNQLAFHHKAP